jgi:PAS domain S-box-containing protein
MITEKIRVLYADDDPSLLDLCKMFLERFGDFTVTTVSGAAEAIRILGLEKFDVIVSDYQMPEMNGIEFLKYLKAGHNTTPFIIFTGKGREEVVIEALNSGADFYIQKGGEAKSQFAELSHKIRKAVEGIRTERALVESEEKYRRIVDTAEEGIMLLDDQFRITYTNWRMAEMLGYTPEEMIGKELRSFMSTGELADHAVRTKRQREGMSDHFERQYMCKDGSILWSSVSVTPIKDANGNFTGSFAMYSDITERKRAEESLRDSEERFRGITERISDLIIVLDPEGYPTFVSPSITSILGFPQESYIGKRAGTDIIPADDVAKMIHAMERLKNGSQKEQIEFRMLKSDGSYAIFDGKGIPVFTNGIYAGVQIVARDITDRKKAEDTLRKSEGRFRALAENASDIIRILDREGRIVFDTEVSSRQLGYPPGYTIGRHPFEFIHPDDLAMVRQELAEVYSKTNTGVPSEFRIRRADGSYTWVESIGKNLIGVPGVDGIVITTRFIDERKKAEEALRASAEKYRWLVETLNEGIWVIDKEAVTTFVNPKMAKMLGYTVEEMTGRSLFSFMDDNGRQDCERKIERRKQGIKEQHDFEFLKKDGTRIYASLEATPLRDNDGKYLGAIAGVTDITERKLSEEALVESEEKFRAVFNNANDAIFLHEMLSDGKPGQYIMVNDIACQRLGYTQDEILSMSPIDIVSPRNLPNIPHIMRIMQLEQHATFDTIYRRKDGSEFPVEVNTHLFDLHGKKVALALSRDLTERKKLEEALKQRQAELHDILQGSPIPMFVIDRDHRVISWNKALEEATGIKAADLLGTTRHWQAFYDKERSCLPDLLVDGKLETIQELYAGKIDLVRLAGGAYDGIDFFPTLGNNGKWLRFSASVIRDADGNVIGAVETLQDITGNKQSAEEIRSLQQFQQSIIDNANVWISVLDPKGTIIVWNTTAEHISGYPAEDVIGKNTVWKQLYPDPVYRKHVVDNILDIIKKNTYVEDFETRIRTKGGDEKIIWWNTQPLRDASGKPVQFIAIGRDNTERRQAEEKLRALRQFEESVIKNANIWISVLDRKGTVSIWNNAAEEISGYRAPEVIGKNTIWSQMYPDKEYRSTVTAKIKEILGANKHLKNFETRIRAKDGLERIIWWNTRALQDIPGISETFIAIGKDVTEQKTLSDAVRLANKKLHLLSSITRHDIVNQLMALRGYLELSRDILGDPDKLAEFITKEQNIASTIEDQIQFTKDYQDLGIKVPEWQNVQESVAKARENLPLQGIAVEIDNPTLDVYADPLLMRVFYNLIDNALRYGGAQMTAIRISSQESPRGLVIFCEDDGVGILAEKKEAIFTQGYFKHTGLGLYLSREILAITGIMIAETGEPGKGTRFEITVPKGMYRFTGTGGK